MHKADTLNAFNEMNSFSSGSAVYFMKMSVQFDARIGEIIVNIKGELAFTCIFCVSTFTR